MPKIKPGGGSTDDGGKSISTQSKKGQDTDWILILKKGESVDIQYED